MIRKMVREEALDGACFCKHPHSLWTAQRNLSPWPHANTGQKIVLSLVFAEVWVANFGNDACSCSVFVIERSIATKARVPNLSGSPWHGGQSQENQRTANGAWQADRSQVK